MSATSTYSAGFADETGLSRLVKYEATTKVVVSVLPDGYLLATVEGALHPYLIPPTKWTREGDQPYTPRMAASDACWQFRPAGAAVRHPDLYGWAAPLVLEALQGVGDHNKMIAAARRIVEAAVSHYGLTDALERASRGRHSHEIAYGGAPNGSLQFEVADLSQSLHWENPNPYRVYKDLLSLLEIVYRV